MEPYLLLAFAGIAATLIVVPGPDWAFILASGLRHHVVVPAVGGLMLGYLMLTVVVAIGVGPLVAAIPWMLTALTFAGAAYLVYLGIVTLRRPPGLIEGGGEPERGPARGTFVARGFGVSALNPKGLLVFLAILPQFARSDAPWPIAIQLAVLGALFVVVCGLFYLALGFVADRMLRSRPTLARLVSRVAGIAMIVIGAALIAERAFAVTSHN
ncbi:LysE family translocator [Diaminobutyricibacter sp. McL0618]|uniref:LysE family translocator n=1 Tax=Leifsonia sp. McL0618 TaxID=3415677 RepID=UPI003CEF6A82